MKSEARIGTGWGERRTARWAGQALLALCCLLALAAGQFAVAEPRAPLSEYYAERWGGREGLPHNMVTSIVQDPSGYLWMSTLEGAVRYSGREFRVFDAGNVEGLRGNAVRGIQVDAQGRVLLATSRDGIARGDARGWQFLRPDREGLPDAMISVTTDRRGRVWAGGENSGVNRFDTDGRLRRFGVEDGLPSAYVNALMEDSRGRLWVGTTRGLAWIENDQVGVADPDAALPAGTVLALLELGDGRILVGSDRGVLLGSIEQGFEPLSSRLPRDQITRLMLDGRGDLWIGTTSFGLLRMSAPLGEQAAIERLDVADGLPNSRVSALARDREGSVWVGTNGGLFRLRLPPVRVFSRRQGLQSTYVRATAQTPDSAIWAGTSSGLYRIAPEGVRRFGRADGLATESVMSLLAEPDGGLWIGTAGGGLAYWDGARLGLRATRADGLAGDQVRALLRSRDGALWVGTTLGLSELRGASIRTWTVAEGLPRDFVIALHEDARGRVLVGTSNGAAAIESGQLRALDLGPDPPKDIFDFHDAADGGLWMATDLGLLRLREEGPPARVGRPAGLPVDAIFQIVPDALGGWWLTSNRGLYRIEAGAAEAVASGAAASLQVRHFNESDGMESAQCNGAAGPAAIAAVDGRLWFGTAGGLAMVDPAAVLGARAPAAPALIESLRIDDVDWPLESPLGVPAGSRRVELQLSGMSLLMPARLQFRYRLSGFEERWIDLGNRDRVQFTSLPPGRYRFEAQARNPGGEWSASAALELDMQPWWWQRREVQFAAVVGLLLAFAGAAHLRTAQLRRSRARLQRLVDEKTADLAAKARALEALAHERGQLADRLRLQSRAFERQAGEDYLTGLLNRRAFDAQLAEVFAEAKQRKVALSLALVDIDFFKRINDQCSHAAGDTALREVAMLIRAHVGGGGVVARWGGEEFAMLLPGLRVAEAKALCEVLRASIEAHDFGALQPGLRMTVSIGVAEGAALGQHEELLQRADEALYRAKSEGRNRVAV